MRQSLMSVRRRWPLWSRIAADSGAVLLAAVSVALGGTAPQSAQSAQSAPPAQQARPRPTQHSAKGPRESQPPIAIDAAFSRVDYNNNTVIFRNIVVLQGDTRLTAQRAHAAGVGFADSEWTFEDRVVIDLEPHGTVRCDRAVVTFRDNRITVATATGGPAQFEQRRADARPAGHGRANRIVYIARDDSVRLSGDAHFTDAQGLEVSGPVLVYDIRNERLQAASPGESRGVHITVPPGSEKGQPAAGGEPGR